MKLLKNKLYKKQRDAFKFTNKNSNAALFLEQGCGKTIVALARAASLWRRQGLRVVLVATPKAVMEGWSRQATQHLNIPHRCYVGPEAVPLGIRVVKADRYKGLVFIILNYERIWRMIGILEDVPWGLIIADESQRIKSPTSRQSKGIYKLGIGVPNKLILSGTPMDKNEMDLWAQFRFLDDTILGNNYYKFRKMNCKQVGYMWFLRPQSKTRIRGKVAPYSFRVMKSEMFDLPPTFDREIRFDMTGKAKRVYDDMEEGHYAECGELSSLSDLGMVNQLRLQQLTGGFFHTGEGITMELEQDKLKTLLDFLEDVPRDRKIVIFARFRDEINILREAMLYQKRTVDVLDGRTKDQGKCWIRFQDKPNPSVLIVQIRTGGVGIDLFTSSLCIFYSINHSFIDYDQMRARLDRNGQTESVEFIKLVANNTVDIDLYNSVYKKGQTAEQVFAEMKQRRKTMSKDKSTKKKDKILKRIKTPLPSHSGHGVTELAKAMGIDPMAARMRLRNNKSMKKLYKTGYIWDFGTGKKIKAVANELKS